MKSRRHNDDGFIEIPVLGFVILMFILVISIGSALIYSAVRERNVVQTTLQTAVKNAVVASVNGPLIINGQGSINADILELSINEQLNRTLAYLQPVVTVTNPPIVYTESDKGLPAPGGLSGTIPGPSVYLELNLTWSMPPLIGYRFEGNMPSKTLVTYPIYNATNQTWIIPQ